MIFLIDACLSHRITDVLNAAGYSAHHVSDVGLAASSDEEILAYALRQSYVIVSADSDFTLMLALRNLPSPSLILLRSSDKLSPASQAELIVVNLPSVTPELASGAVVSMSPTFVRVRRLPMNSD